MSPSGDNDPTPLAQALGRVPTGLYVVTTRDGEEPLGFVGSFVMQVGFAPPTLCVAVARERPQLAAMRDSGVFGVSILDEQSSDVMGRFFGRREPGTSPFDGLATTRGPAGSLLLDEALAWLECRVSGEHDAKDHVVVFGEVTAGGVAREGDPSVRLRKSGLDY